MIDTHYNVYSVDQAKSRWMGDVITANYQSSHVPGQIQVNLYGATWDVMHNYHVQSQQICSETTSYSHNAMHIMHWTNEYSAKYIIFINSTETKQLKLIHFTKIGMMSPQDDQERSKYIMKLKR